jgi:hypothetical protein
MVFDRLSRPWSLPFSSDITIHGLLANTTTSYCIVANLINLIL